MKNKVTIFTEHFWYYKVKDSKIGRSKNRLHPSLNKDLFYTGDNHHLKVGDILRCDGLPFMSRPRPIKTIDYNMNTDRLSIHRKRSLRENITHKPVQLPSGFWVLRPI